jgi:hypothetical protein
VEGGIKIRRLKPLIRLQIPQKPDKPQRNRPPNRGRFRRVERRRRDFPPPTPQATPCILWQGALDRYGYGALKRNVDGVQKSYKIHRWIMELYLDRQLGPKEVILHACDNPPCYAIDHLSVGTIASNNRDMLLKGRASPPPVNVFYGKDNWNTKLSPADHERIWIRWQYGEKPKQLADDFEVSLSTIYNVININRRANSDEKQRQRRAGQRALGSEGGADGA